MHINNNTISHRQLFRQVIVSFLGIFLLQIPGWESLVGRVGVLCVFIGGFFLFFYIIYLIRLSNLFTNMEKNFGKIISRMIILLYLSYLVVTGIFLLLTMHAVVSRFLVKNAAGWIIMGLAIVICCQGSKKGLEARGRMAEVIYPVITGAVVIMFVLAVFQVHPDYLEQSASITVENLGWGSYGIFCAFAPMVLLPFTLSRVEKSASTKGTIMGAAGLLAAFLILAFIVLQGTYGIQGLLYKQFPVIDLMKGVGLPGNFLQRVDVFWIIFILFSVLFALGSIFFYQNELLSSVHWEKYRILAVCLMYAGAVICKQMSISPSYYGWLLKWVYVPLFLLVTLAIGIIKRRRIRE